MRCYCAVLAGLGLGVAAPALAQEQEPPPPVDTGDSITIALGGGYTPSYEGSDQYVFIPAAAVRGRVAGFSFFSRGTQIFADALPEDEGETLDLSIGPVLSVRLDRTRRIKDDQVRALGKKDTAIEVGGWVGIAKTGVITSAYDTLSFRVSYLKDVSDTHDSFIVTPAIEYGTPLSMATYVGISVSADYVGDGYARTYFSVDPAGAAASGLPLFEAEGGFKNLTFGLLANHAFSGDLRRGLSIFAIGSYSRLFGDFADSPVVQEAGDADQWFGAVGLAYTF